MLRVTGLLLLFLATVVLSVPKPSTKVTEDEMIQILAQYEVSASAKCRDYVEADWNYNTDVENEIKVEELVSKNCILLKDWMFKHRFIQRNL
jgi:hypothetical protein